MHDLTAPALLDALTLLLSQASAEILRIADGALDAREKSDATPVTAADEASEAVLLTGLDRLLPGIDIISEEAAAQTTPCKPGDTFILVDPLDGTREILAGRDEYTINVAIVHGGRPLTGVLASPARGLIWRGTQGKPSEALRIHPGEGPDRAEHKVIRTRAFSSDRPVALVSRSHLDPQTENFLTRWPRIEKQGCGSALKFGLLAQGEADIYPRLAPTSEWDIAAGDAILTGAGGRVVTPDGAPVLYGRHAGGFRIPAFIAWGDATAAQR
ncbi:MAG TPA: 3'(2'),5'-bisphosphate nucleotidase CysQ [Pseudorhodoplanes sp.]|nr:3'(2'),5'-bisphosphate nucleotidase CysQ [Pseudorhodoplanes sp.]